MERVRSYKGVGALEIDNARETTHSQRITHALSSAFQHSLTIALERFFFHQFSNDLLPALQRSFDSSPLLTPNASKTLALVNADSKRTGSFPTVPSVQCDVTRFFALRDE